MQMSEHYRKDKMQDLKVSFVDFFEVAIFKYSPHQKLCVPVPHSPMLPFPLLPHHPETQ